MDFMQSMSSSRNKGRISVAKLIAIEPPLMVLNSTTLYSSPCQPPGSSSENNLAGQIHRRRWPVLYPTGRVPTAHSHTRPQQWTTFRESKEETQSNEHIIRNRSRPF